MKKLFLFLFISAVIIACKKDESSLTTSSSSNTTVITNTWVKLSVLNLQGDAVPGLKVMMFRVQPSNTSPLPPIIKEVTSDANGLAYFDLNNIVTTSIPVTYYFEAFRESGEDLIWESINHPSWEITKGTMVTSSILVD